MIRTILLSTIAVTLAGCAEPPVRASNADVRTAVSGDRHQPRDYIEITHPEWTRNAAIYQLNLRQFSAEGTLAAAQKELPRLKDLGVDIIWLMPIHPIGEKNRKGTLGSPYSVKDYRAVNPEFGDFDDLKAFVDAAHDLGLRVILDWVANHTAWDNPLVTEHPEWYERDWKGEFRPTPWWDWSDIIDLDFSHADLRRYMADAMAFWVREAGVDGFRCDVAGYVPLDFWEETRRELEAIKPVFMLAEFEERDVHARAFDATYAWSFSNAAQSVAQGRSDVGAFFGYYSGNESAWPRDAYRMTYVSNHDFNSWHGTDRELYGDALPAVAALSVVGEGMPLIYNGQEAGNDKRLAFFEKDPIVWRDDPMGDLYRRLFRLKKDTKALWNGAAGARMVPVVNSAPTRVLSFVRFGSEDGVFAAFNFSAEEQRVTFERELHHGAYEDFASGEATTIDGESSFSMAPWEFRVFVRR